jgi:spermidine synthase
MLVAPPAAGGAGARLLLPTLALLFFVSGMCGLIYQVLWLRLLALVFGVTVYAASTVLASFMGGLALGSLVAGRLVDRAARPLLWYGVAEILVGLSALATPAALGAVERLYVALYPSLPHALPVLTLARFLFAFAVLIVPTTLMGATLPIVVKSSLLRGEGVGRRAGLLYGTNTAGAILGTLLAGFFLIGSLGVSASFLLAAGLNILVGLAAVAASPALEWGSAGPPERAQAADAGTDTAGASGGASPRARRLVLITFALSGFTSLALEVIWFRVLSLLLETNTYAFTVMLATVLCGIALGSYLAAPLLRRGRDWVALLALLAGVEMAIGVAAALSLPLLALAGGITALFDPVLQGRHEAGRALQILVASSLAIFPTTLLLGVAFPVGLHLWASGGTDLQERVGERVGRFYALNLLGAILGSAAGGFLLLPRLGSRGSILVLAAISLASGPLLLTALPRARRAFALRAVAVGGLLFLAAALAVPDPFALALSQRHPGEELLWRREGVQTTVSVHRRPDGTRVMYLDGHHQANDSAAMVSYHRLIGHLAMALHPDPREALVIGLGGGATAGAVSRHAGARVDVVELSRSVAEGAGWFRHVNHDVLGRPNVRLRVDDGRNYLLLTPKRYDVVTADIVVPRWAGANHLYAAEYYRLVRKALKDGGLMLQWNGGESETEYKLILRTFLSVFPHATLWEGGRLMVGTKEPLRLERAAFERKLRDPETRRALQGVKLGSFEALLSRYMAGPQEARRFAGAGPLLTDDKPRIEYFLSLPRASSAPDLSGLRGQVRRHVGR